MKALRTDFPALTTTDPVRRAVQAILDSDLPALPVSDPKGRFAGVFGEREFLEAAFPGYFKQLKYAAFVPEGLDSAFEHPKCLGDAVGDHLNREHVDVASDASDVALAETFLHHRVLIVPVVDDGRVVGLVRRADFFRGVAERLLARDDGSTA